MRHIRPPLAILTALLLTRLVLAAEAVPYSPALAEKSRCTVAIDKLHPTQFCVGLREVEQLAAEIGEKDPAKLKEYLDEHVPLIVIGPQGVPYLVDGHHLCAALLRAKAATQVEVQVEANWRDLEPLEFWKEMHRRGWYYPYDSNNRGQLFPVKLPGKVIEMADDPYRSLAWAVRERGGWQKVNTPLAEFRWACFFRTWVPIGKQPGDFERAIEAALKLCHTRQAKGLPGYVPVKDGTQVPAPKAPARQAPAPNAEDALRRLFEEEQVPPAQPYKSPQWAYLLLAVFALFFALIMHKGGGESSFMDRIMQRNLTSRGMGMFLILWALAIAFMFVYEPYVQARARQEMITVWRGCVAFPVLFFLMGLILVIAGKHAKKFLVTQFGQEWTTLRIITAAVQLTLSLGLEFWLMRLFERWGYRYAW